MKYRSKYGSIDEVRAALDAAALALCRTRGDTETAPSAAASQEAAAIVAAFLRALPNKITIVTGDGSFAGMSGFESLARMVDSSATTRR